MQQSFECIVDSYLANNVGITTNFLSMKLAAALKENLLTLSSESLLKQAGFGNNNKLTKNDFIRSDKIFWLDRKHNNRHENAFFNLKDGFVSCLKQKCYCYSGLLQTINPVNGSCVVFKSNELEHEVLLSNKPRLFIKGLLKSK